MIRLNWMRRVALTMAAAPLLLLAGCPSDQTAAPGKAPAQTTAPPLKATQRTASPLASAPTQAPDAPPASAKAQGLIARAEASYRSGVANYQANRLDAARMDFDTAVDTMLSSGLDLKADPALSDEIEHLLDAVNSLEMAALKQGNGFSPKIEEAPVDAIGDLTFAPDPELTARLRSQLQIKSDLPLVINDEVAGYIGAFANSISYRAHMAHSLARSGKYKAMIQKALADEGLPQDLFYLAVAESGFQPQALNPKSGAGGMWQFMPTGAYGLARNGYVDERFDPEKSSVAYARYMKSVYKQLGDWYLAMAGYDWGPGSIQRAVMRTGYADFWQLYRRNMLPKETRDYVPKILAAIIMAKNPAQYGLDKVVADPPVVYDTISVSYAIDLRLVADLTNATLPEIVGLNPSLLRMTTPSDFAFDLHIPPGTRTVFLDRLKNIPEEKRTSWRFHVAHTGESLDAIASSLHAHASEIAETNGLKPGESLEDGDELVVPITFTFAAARPAVYTVHRGDTLVSVADRFNVSASDLRSWNHLSGRSFRAGKTVRVSEPVRLGPTMQSRRGVWRSKGSKRRGGGRYQVVRGASRSSIRSLSHGAKSSSGSRAHGAIKRAPAQKASSSTHAHAHAVPTKKRKAAR